VESRQIALDLTFGVDPTPKAIERVAKAVGPELGRWAFGQWALRDRARSKFTRASEMLFDRPALEMASHESVASFHASRFPADVVVADLTAGIGADLIALGRRGPVIGFEIDPIRAEYATYNLAVHDEVGEIKCADSVASEWDFEYAFSDPARRVESGRTWNPDEFSPHPIKLADRLQGLRLGAMKLSPMLRDEFFRHFEGRLEFVSFDGECREALVWLGSEAGSGRAAVRAEDGLALEAGEDAETTGEASGFLFEADPAAVRAHSLGTLARSLGLLSLGDSNGYLTSDVQVGSPWLTPYHVLADHSADLRRTNAVLRSLNAGTPIIKSRVPRLDVQALQRQLRGEGRELIVTAYPSGKQVRHAVLERL
jgi:hypothetical protein